jgi:hypothetical protein
MKEKCVELKITLINMSSKQRGGQTTDRQQTDNTGLSQTVMRMSAQFAVNCCVLGGTHGSFVGTYCLKFLTLTSKIEA